MDSDLTVFPEFEGTLYLEDSATLDTLVGLFPVGSEYTLSCLSGAVPKDNIPDGVTVDYRDEASGAADKSAASGGETVYGTVVSDESYLSGRTIYRSAEGWLYLKDDYNIYLWGIDKKNTLPDVETITIPDQIQGMDVTWIYEGFSSRIEKNNGADVKSLVIPDTVIGVWFNALEQFTGLTTIEGGNGLESFSFNGDVPESCPFYRNNMFNNLILGKGLLVHCSIGEDGAVKIPKGVTRMLAFPLYTLSKDNYYVETSITSITLPDSLQALDALTLAPTYGSLHISEFRVPDGVTLDKWVFGDSSDSKNIIEELKTIRIGKHVQLGEFVASDLTVFPKFKGTLYLEDGATLDTLVGLFPAGSKYTLSCEKDAVPDSGIPKGVKVKVR